MGFSAVFYRYPNKYILLSNRLKLVARLQNSWRGPSSNELLSAMTASLRRTCVWLLLMPNRRRSHWHRRQYLFEDSANGISSQRALLFYWYQNVLPKGCRGADWWAMFEWFQVQIVAPGDVVPHRFLCTHSGLLPWSFELLCLTLAAPIAATSFHRCWSYKDPRWLARFGYYSKIVEAGVKT